MHKIYINVHKKMLFCPKYLVITNKRSNFAVEFCFWCKPEMNRTKLEIDNYQQIKIKKSCLKFNQK